MTTAAPSEKLFNTPLEAGVRAVIVLEAFAPEAFDLRTLSLLDYHVVHTEDVGGPSSVHPALEARAGEFIVRRSLVESGVAMMVRSGIVERSATSDGIIYRAAPTAAPMLDLMVSEYNLRLHASARWLAERAGETGLPEFLGTLRSSVDSRVDEMVGQPS